MNKKNITLAVVLIVIACVIWMIERTKAAPSDLSVAPENVQQESGVSQQEQTITGSEKNVSAAPSSAAGTLIGTVTISTELVTKIVITNV
jgi:hypothetical protein